MSSDEAKPEKDWWEELPKCAKSQIAGGLNDIAHGRLVSSKEFWEILQNDDHDKNSQ